jgi:Ca2+-binding RTX toxin-like protein
MSIHVIQPRLLRSSQSLVDRILPIPKSAIVGVLAFTLIFTLAGPANTATAAPVGQGFTVTTSDLAFILRQIKIAEAHVANTTSATGPCGALIGPGADHVPDALTSYGLRTVDGTCNNLIQGREKFGAADQLFPRLTAAKFNTADERSPFGPPGQSTYAQKSGSVVDSQPRVVSNLIVDQTSTNPAAIHAAGFPVRSQQAPGKFPCTTDPDPLANPPIVGVPGGCVPTGETLFVPNITTDVGLSPPYNSLFTLFGQFFDHGVDQTVKGGGTVFVPLKEDDPLRTVGPDGKAGSGDEVSPQQAFMVLTRAQNQPGSDPGTADDIQEAKNTDSPFVDQSQTYTSHASHQVFLREYANNNADKPVSTGKLLGGPPGRTEGGMATWATVKAQAASLLGLRLEDKDVLNVPQMAVDPYGKFIPGPLRGLPQFVTPTGLVEGDLANPVPVPANVVYFDTPFLTDIAHNADPSPQDLDRNPSTPRTAPVADDNTTAANPLSAQPAGTYDDEALALHFAAGDGRVNENIGLTAIHQVFHSEHDRLVAEFKKTLEADTSAKGVAALAEWKLAQGAVGWNGERLFQAARFVNEMEYQHLVFEEFGRKVQPAIDPFVAYHTDVDPAVKAEFAHAVYRFGHSMLTETISRTNPDGTDNSIGLLEGFLNPAEYTNAGTDKPALSSEEAAGSIIMGMSDQAGNEIDEFVTDTLRNNLLGLPLDLASINMARAREAGIPSLNELRRQIHAETNDAQLAPYTSWADFGQNVKHPESIINFVAAYGTYPTIAAAANVADRRAAAMAIVDPGPQATAPTADMVDFMNSAGTWAGKETGLNSVDLWVGGLAEKTNLFGGLLGSTFNYVFENQMTDLQNGDRFYYLARTPGMNLRAALEGNSFAEMMMRNTTAESLKADAFATADCKFQLKNLAGTPEGYAALGATVADDANTECAENLVLLRKPDGTIQYREINPADPPGINGQAVYNGTDAVDRVTGGNDNDTFLGNDGNDIIEGQGGDDIALGGDGNDRMTDLAGNDVTKGGPGNDYINTGIGLDIVMSGDGKDFTDGGANDNETFAGEGDDFIQSGAGTDHTFGDGGDDWIQGGSGVDLLIGDHGAPFFDDPAANKPGHDVFVGQVGDNDYDAEGGDDVMSSNAGIDRYSGAAGFDWATHQYDTVAADDDMMINNNLIGVPLPVVVNRDRWQEVEANSGSTFNDLIRGDDVVPSAVGGAGFTGCDVLDQAGIDRIAGLDDILPTPTTPLAPIEAASALGSCPLEGPVWGDGNILLGGLGSDTIEGRGADDVIDGDRYLKTRISVRNSSGDEIGSTELMERPYQAHHTRTLAADVASGLIDPGNLFVVREIVTPTATQVTGNRDSAVFSDIQANYTVTTTGGNGTLGSPGSTTTVVHNGGGADGTDTLRNIERLVFSDTVAPTAPVIGVAVAGDGQATVNFTAPTGSISQFSVRVVDPAGAQVGDLRTVPADAGSIVVTGLTNGTAYRFQVSATNAEGTSPYSALSVAVTPHRQLAPGAARIGTVTRGDTEVTVNWSAPVPVADTAAAKTPAITGYVIRTFAGTTLVRETEVGTVTSAVIGGLNNGTAYTFEVSAVNPVNTGAASERSASVTPAGRPGVPVIGVPTAGDGSVTVRWTAPDSNGMSITGYSVRVFTGPTLARTVTITAPATSTVITGLTNGTAYNFDVAATNGVGDGARSANSAVVTPTAPGVRPTITARTPGSGAFAVSQTGNLTATFSGAVTTVNTTTFALRLGTATTGASVPAGVTYNATTRVATLNPTPTLAADTRYTATLSGIGSPAGTLPTSSWTFVTGPAATLTARTPGTSATGASLTANITATFSEPVTNATQAGRVVLRLGSTTVPAVVTYNATTRVVTLNPNANLTADRSYTVSVSGVLDGAGNTMATATWPFITGPRPTMSARLPASAATGVARNANVTATMSEVVQGFSTTSTTTSSVRLIRVSNGGAVPAAITFNTTTRQFTVNPNASLAANVQYRVTFTGGTSAIRDLAGNPMSTQTWTFTTGAA